VELRLTYFHHPITAYSDFCRAQQLLSMKQPRGSLIMISLNRMTLLACLQLPWAKKYKR